MSTPDRTIYITLDDGVLNERTRAMRGLVQAMQHAATTALGVVEVQPDGSGGFLRRDNATPVQLQRRDILLVAASGWLVPGFLLSVAAAKSLGASVAVLVHDIARLRRPEWYSPQETALFRVWLETLLQTARYVLVPSLATAKDLAGHLREAKLPEVETIRVRLGDGMLVRDGDDTTPDAPSPYVLVAGPLEIRLNHVVLVEAWRRLGLRLKPSELPRLVFAGTLGPLSGDMRARLARGSDPKIEMVLDPDDTKLAALYRGCEFSIFPALYEGWGIAVTESLCFGKPVFAANAMALPEAGGRLARYFDPLDPEDTARHIERVLLDKGDLRRWIDEISRVYVKTAWSDTARAVFAALS